MSLLPFLILQIVIFVGLVIGLRRILRHNLTEAAGRLQALNAEYSRRHEELKQRAGEAEQLYTEQVSRAKAESQQLIVQAKQEAESSRARLLEEARTESERIVQQGMESREAMRRELEQSLEQRAMARACDILQAAIPAPLRQDLHSRWLSDLMQNGLAQLERAGAGEHILEAKVASAFPLTPEQRKLVHDRLKKALGHDLTLTEDVQSALVAGIVITVGSVVFDGSLASKIQQVVRHAQHAA